MIPLPFLLGGIVVGLALLRRKDVSRESVRQDRSGEPRDDRGREPGSPAASNRDGLSDPSEPKTDDEKPSEDPQKKDG